MNFRTLIVLEGLKVLFRDEIVKDERRVCCVQKSKKNKK